MTRVLLQVGRPGPSRRSAGGLRALRAARGLRTLGLDAHVSADLAPDLSTFDLVHLFATTDAEATFRHALRARAARMPIVLTPDEADSHSRDSVDDATRAKERDRELLMRDITLGLADALLLPATMPSNALTSGVAVVPAMIVALPADLDARLRGRRSGGRRAAEQMALVYEHVMGEGDVDETHAWRATLTPEQYIEHLESLIQLQLETIAFRDTHYAGAREREERAAEYAASLEAELEHRGACVKSPEDEFEHRGAYVKSLERGSGVRRALAARLARFRR